LTSSRPPTFYLTGRRASLGLSACLGHGVKMPRLHFYNQRSRHEHSISTPLLETACQMPAGCPAGSRLRDRLPEILVRCRHLAFQDPAPDRLSVIRPPAAMRLTAHLPASVRSTAAWTLARPSGELRRFFGSPDALSIRPSDTSFSSLPSARSPREEVGPLSGRLILARRGHVNASSRSEIEAPSIVRDRSGRSCEIPFRRAAPAGRPVQLPRVFTVVLRLRLDLSSPRFHGTNRGRARPYDFCKWLSPRARLWTTRASRSTESAVETAARARQGVSFLSWQPPEVHRVRGRANRCPTFPSRLLAPETSPQPRSLRAPGVARRLPSPVWSDAVRRGAADVERPCKERPPKGWYGAGPPRRGPALTNPRCLPSRRRSRTNGHCLPAGADRPEPAPFSPSSSGAGRRPRSFAIARRADW
jgi:hypothetical protein